MVRSSEISIWKAAGGVEEQMHSFEKGYTLLHSSFGVEGHVPVEGGHRGLIFDKFLNRVIHRGRI